MTKASQADRIKIRENNDEKRVRKEKVWLMKNKKIFLQAALPLLAALLSIFVISKYAASPEFHQKTIQALDEKKTTVMELAAASTAASAAITLIPGDAATPIAEKLADFSTYFLVVICAIYLEKYLVTITGYAAFVILIPLACVLLAINAYWKSRTCIHVALKLILFGLAIALVIPASVKVSDMIETAYESSIEETIDAAKEAAELAETGKEEAESEAEKKGFLDGIISSVQNGVSSATEKVENILNNFIEALAVMLVTSCVIPVLVLVFFVWIIKMVLNVDVSWPRRGGE